MPSEKRVSRKWLYIAWGAALFVVVLYYGVWRWAAGEMETAARQWVADNRAAGLTVDHGAMRRSGFPFFLRIHFDEPHIAVPGGVYWRAERLALDALPYDLTKLILSPEGEQRVRLPDDQGQWTFAADAMRASFAADKERDWVFSVTIEALNAQSEIGETARLQSLIFDIAPDPAALTTLTLALAGAGLDLADATRSVSLDTLNTAMSLSETPWLTNAEGAAAAWRAAGGELDVHGFAATAGDARFSASGVVRLDSQHRPAGELRAVIEKPAALGPLIAATGVLTREDADAAAAGLALLAIAQGGAIKAPVQLHNGEARISGVKIANLPAIDGTSQH